jgi:putative transposase
MQGGFLTAFGFGQPEIWNSDQGAQFTAADFLAPLKKRGIAISMDGRGALFQALENYFHFYNHRRPHQALGYRTPADLFPHQLKRKRSSS